MKVYIQNLYELAERIEEYITMFPKTHTTIENIQNGLLKEYERTNGNTGLFGLQVSPEWESRCYGFEFVSHKPITFRFVGMFKC